MELNKEASIQEIKKSYKNLARKYHPDLNPGQEEKFREITTAYEILSNPEKKEKYDNPDSKWVSLFNMSVGHSLPSMRRSNDVNIVLTLSFEEAYYGTVKPLEYDSLVGSDFTIKQQTVFLDIPQVRTGDVLTIPKMGSSNGDIPGSLVVKIDVEEDDYKISGLDITCEKEIPDKLELNHRRH